jgi:hypothetical protein
MITCVIPALLGGGTAVVDAETDDVEVGNVVEASNDVVEVAEVVCVVLFELL